MSRALIWFRRDLRIHDHPALTQAASRHREGLIAAYVITPYAWRAHDDAAVKVDFWLRSLRALSEALRERNVPLKVLRADDDAAVAEGLLALARRARCDALYFHHEHEVNERRRDARVGSAFRAAGIEVSPHHDRTLVAPDALRTGGGTPYSVFTPYRRAWTAALTREPSTPLPPIAAQVPVELEGDPVPRRVEGFESEVPASLWPTGEARAQDRLARFVSSRLLDYHLARDLPAEDGTSALSPYLAAGVLSPRQCLHAAREANGGRIDEGAQGALTWISELAWRDFYQQVLVHAPRVSMGRAYKRETEALPWREAPDELARWQQGQTGFPLVDAAMRQLAQTGWMHNRLRMLVAMFLTKDLLIDWRHGERHFMRRLVDGDLAANNGGWQWCASTGTDAQPWFRIFNPWSQAARFDPDARFVRRWVPELNALSPKEIHAMGALPRPGLSYPAPMVDHALARRRTLAAFESLKR